METTESRTTISSLLDKGKLFLKSFVIFVIALGLWIPTYLILDVVKERKGRQKEAITEISSKWAGKQVVNGPLLMIPYNEVRINDKGIQVWEQKNLYFMPDKSEIDAKVYPEKRHRGIYQVAVYRSDIIVTAKFKPLQWQRLNISPDNIMWSQAKLVFKVQDNIKGINEDISISWDDSSRIFIPQPTGPDNINDGFAAETPLSVDEANKEHNCVFKFSLNGSEQLLFTASARENKLHMQSDWPNPSFTGVKLPDERVVRDSGFVADWKYLNRAVPQVWKDNYYDLSEAQLGADLMIPVDSYDKTERSIKYALLCIILTFAAFFLVETIYKRPLHLIQYCLAGLALVLFYTLLLSISEYIGFNPAYLIASVATIGLVAWYVGSVMKSSKLSLFIAFVLTVVYSYIFTIIQLQDYALLMGSIGLFIALGIIMYFSRKLQW